MGYNVDGFLVVDQVQLHLLVLKGIVCRNKVPDFLVSSILGNLELGLK